MADRIGFIGLGAMGGPMAANLARKGHDMTVYDTDIAKTVPLAELGASVAGSVAELTAAVDLVITMLPDGPDVEAVLLGPGGVRESGRPDMAVIDMSTIAPATTDRLFTALTEAGIGFADAPVGRLVAHAIRGESLFMVGASGNDFGRVKPVLEGMGSTIHHCGGPGSGIRTKLVNNLIAISVCQVNAEAVTLAQAFGLDIRSTLDVINGTTATNGHLVSAWPNKVLVDDTDPGFRIRLAHKDVALALDAAKEAGIPMIAGSAVAQALTAAKGTAGFGERDFSALLDFVSGMAGIKPPRFDT